MGFGGGGIKVGWVEVSLYKGMKNLEISKSLKKKKKKEKRYGYVTIQLNTYALFVSTLTFSKK